MPSEAASDYVLVRELLACGMNCMRINAAHDDEVAWKGMIENLRCAERELGKPCKVLMDVPGPKLRTGPTGSARGVIKVSPKRDSLGNVMEKAKIWLAPIEKPETPRLEEHALITVPGEWLSQLLPGDRIKFFDARGMARSMNVTMLAGNNRLAESDQTSYLISETILQLFRNGCTNLRSQCRIGPIPETPQPRVLKPGDILHLLPNLDPARSSVRNEHGRYLEPPSIGVTLPEIFSDVEPEQKIWFDDGKIGGVIRAVRESRITVEITAARAKGEKLRADKRINLPDTELTLPALTDNDIARGDLAVECGYERTGELQEEIMWIGEAAHVPVIWATQVLEYLAKKGQPSRAEITDAAMAEQAECVMLNKGPYMIDAVKVLDDVLRRMQCHQAKKSSLLRPLAIADNFAR
jgi:pyruvate kinase